MFITRSLKNLLDKLFFACLLLLGIQVPNFVIQYQQIIGAHYIESRNQLQQYQAVANQFYAGDIDRLLVAHQNNAVPAIRAEAEIIAVLIQRSAYLQQELNALQNRPLPEQLLHLLKRVDFEIFDELLNSYSISVPINSEAIIAGLIFAFSFYITTYFVLAILMQLFRPRQRNGLFYHP